MWLSGLSTGLQTKRLLVQIQVRTHAWVAGQVPSRGRVKDNLLLYLSHIDVSLPVSPSLPLKIFFLIHKKGEKKKLSFLEIPRSEASHPVVAFYFLDCECFAASPLWFDSVSTLARGRRALWW